MPEMHFSVRWPDGLEELCYSPSLVIEEHLTPGTGYPLADFLARSRTALGIASERVRAKYGFPCAHAMRQLATIEARGQSFADQPDAGVTVLAFHR